MIHARSRPARAGRERARMLELQDSLGGARRPLLIESAGNFFIGPDNGVLSLAAAGAESMQIFQLNNPDYQLKPTSASFHGRDIFAPAAAHLSLGVAPAAFGEQLASFTKLRVPKVTQIHNRWEGEVVYIDGYGNLFTNIDERDLTGQSRDKLTVAVGSSVPPAVAAAAALGGGATVSLAVMGPRLGGRGLRDALPYVRVGFFFGTSYVLLFEAFFRGRVSVVSPLIATESLWGVVLSVLLLRESEVVGRRLLVGAALIVAGGALIGAYR